MSLHNKNIEEIFSNGFDEFRLEPDTQVLRNLRFKLWKADFLSLNMRKFNLVYAVVILTGLVSIPFMAEPEKSKTAAQTESVVSELELSPENKVTVEKVEQVTVEEENNSPESALIPSARFNVSTLKGCAPLEVNFDNKSVAAKTYKWNFGDGKSSTLKNPLNTYNKPGIYTATLEINNQLKYSKEILVFDVPESDFIIDLKSSDINSRTVRFKNLSKGAKHYKWNFGDNTTSTDISPLAHAYPTFKTYNVSLIAISKEGCSDTVTMVNTFIEKDYSLYFPSTFRPNTSGPNNNGMYGNESNNSSVFYPENNGAKNYELNIYSSSGAKVFSTNNIAQGWNGYYRGRLAPAGIYRYETEGVYPNGKPFKINGKVKVIVDSYQDNY